jgi:hypothetical protein
MRRGSLTKTWSLCLIDSFQVGEIKAKKLVVHIDNASARDARVTQNFFEHDSLQRLPQPPYSPNISPSDLYLFGKVKNALIGQEIPDDIALLELVMAMLGGISGNELQAVFRNWIEPVQGMIDADGGYPSS